MTCYGKLLKKWLTKKALIIEKATEMLPAVAGQKIKLHCRALLFDKTDFDALLTDIRVFEVQLFY